MALRFGRKKGGDGEGDGQEGPKGPADFTPQPDNARRWFDQARKMAESSNHDAALFYYAHGIKLDPTPMSAHEAMFKSALLYNKSGGKPASGKDVKKLDGPHPVDKFAAAEFAWLKDLNSSSAAVKFLESSIKAMQWGGEAGRWHCQRVLNVLRGQKKTSKGSLLSAKDLFAQLGAWDEAIGAAAAALQLDPTDAELQGELSDLAAQRAMDQGRYEEAAGEEGGFRKFVKDADKQRELEEAESISGGLDVERRNLARAQAEYEANSGTPDSINKYGQLLKAVSTDEARKQAFDVFMKGYKDTGQYRFRAAAGDIRIEVALMRVRALEAKAAITENSDAKARLDEARQKLAELRHAEYAERVKEYPTDRGLKQQLGEVLFDLARYDDAIQCFQESKDDPKRRVRSGHMLGRCFAAEAWHDMAIQEYKDVLGHVEAGDRDAELAIRYDLMVSLIEYARSEGSLDHAREALEICSSIARRDITFRDIRNRRREVDELVKTLSSSGSSASSE